MTDDSKSGDIDHPAQCTDADVRHLRVTNNQDVPITVHVKERPDGEPFPLGACDANGETTFDLFRLLKRPNEARRYMMFGYTIRDGGAVFDGEECPFSYHPTADHTVHYTVAHDGIIECPPNIPKSSFTTATLVCGRDLRIQNNRPVAITVYVKTPAGESCLGTIANNSPRTWSNIFGNCVIAAVALRCVVKGTSISANSFRYDGSKASTVKYTVPSTGSISGPTP